MVNVSLGKKRLERMAATVMLLLSLFGPMSAFASTILPKQVIPPGTGNVCSQVTFSDIQAHVYAGSLDSFDINISDPAYVAISTVVAHETIGYNYITRWANPDGTVKMHVDLQPTDATRNIPIQIVFMAAKSQSGAQVTCLFEVPATVVAASHGQGTHDRIPGQTTSTHPRPIPSGNNNGSGAGSQEPTSTASSSQNQGLVSAMSSLGSLCTNGGSSRLWVVLLVLFALFCFILCAQRFEVNSSVRDWNIGLILAVFIGLLIFWYVSATCRTGAWAPAVATLITIAGLLYTMLKADDTQEILLLKDGKK